jgi:hypothetical protein
MPNGKPGDHPLTDILVHGRRVYSEAADALVREIASLGGARRIADLLFFEFNDRQNPDVRRLERVLAEVRDGMLRDSASGRDDG